METPAGAGCAARLRGPPPIAVTSREKSSAVRTGAEGWALEGVSLSPPEADIVGFRISKIVGHFVHRIRFVGEVPNRASS